MKRAIPVIAMLLCTSALASQPEDFGGRASAYNINSVSTGPTTIVVGAHEGPVIVTGPTTRIGKNGPEVIAASVKPVEARDFLGKGNPLQARDLVSYPKTQMREHGSVSSMGAKGVDVGRGGTLNSAEVSAYKPCVDFREGFDEILYGIAQLDASEAKPAETASRHMRQEGGTVYISQPRVTRTLDGSVTAVGYDGSVDGPLPAGTKTLVIPDVQAVGFSFNFRSDNKK